MKPYLLASRPSLGVIPGVRLEWITRNLLDLSRFDAGLVDLDLADHDLGELLDAAASAFRPLAQDTGITFSIRPPTPPLQLRCDRARIELALSNLVDNALKFTASGGQMEVGGERQGEAVRLWVWDNGSGIDPEDLPHVFERFYRGQGIEQTGSGLGLTIVRAILDQHGAPISVHSRPGQGATFTFRLPVAR